MGFPIHGHYAPFSIYAFSHWCYSSPVARQLHTSEEVLSRSYGPSNVLRLSFRDRKKKQEDNKAQHDHRKQHNGPSVTKETAPPPVNTTGDYKYVICMCVCLCISVYVYVGSLQQVSLLITEEKKDNSDDMLDIGCHFICSVSILIKVHHT